MDQIIQKRIYACQGAIAMLSGTLAEAMYRRRLLLDWGDGGRSSLAGGGAYRP